MYVFLMANTTDNFPLNFDNWNISLVNSTFSGDGDSNGLDFYTEVGTYWMSKVKLYVVITIFLLYFCFSITNIDC